MRFALKNYQILNLDVLRGSLDGVRQGREWDFVFEIDGWCSLKNTSIKEIIFEVDDCPISPINVALLERPDLVDLGIDGKGISIWLPFYLFVREVNGCRLKIVGCDGNCYNFVEFELVKDHTLLRQLSLGKSVQFAPLFSMGRSGSTALMKFLKEKDYIKIPGEGPYENRVLTYLVSRALLTIRTLNLSFVSGISGCYFLKNDMSFFDEQSLAQKQKKEIDSLIVLSSLNSCIESISTYLSKMQESSFYVEKISSSGIECLCLLSCLFETKGIILLRDLRDLICSARQYKIRFPSSDFTDFSTEEEYKELAQITKQMLIVMKVFSSWKIIRYEQLIQDSKTLSKQLDLYFGRVNKKRTKRKDKRVLQFKKNHITSESVEHSVGRWRTDVYFLEHIEWFDRHLKDLNESLGYK